MKKKYVKPEATELSVLLDEEFMIDAGGIGGVPGVSNIPIEEEEQQ